MAMAMAMGMAVGLLLVFVVVVLLLIFIVICSSRALSAESRVPLLERASHPRQDTSGCLCCRCGER